MARCVTKNTKLIDENNPDALRELQENLAVIDKKIWFLESYLTQKHAIGYSLLYFLRRIPGLKLTLETYIIAVKIDEQYRNEIATLLTRDDAKTLEQHIRVGADVSDILLPAKKQHKTEIVKLLESQDIQLSAESKLLLALHNTHGQGPLNIDKAIVEECLNRSSALLKTSLSHKNPAGYSLYYLLTHHPEFGELLKNNAILAEHHQMLVRTAPPEIWLIDAEQCEALVKCGVFSPSELLKIPFQNNKFKIINFLLAHGAVFSSAAELKGLLFRTIHNNSQKPSANAFIEWAFTAGQISPTQPIEFALNRTALHIAAEFKNDDALALCLGVAEHLDVNVRDWQGTTPLHLVQLPEMAECLLEKGANPYALSDAFETPKDTSKKNPAVMTVIIGAQKKLEATYQNALAKNDMATVRACLARGVRVSTTDFDGIENPELRGVLEQTLRVQETHFHQALARRGNNNAWFMVLEFLTQRYVSEQVTQETINKMLSQQKSIDLENFVEVGIPFTTEQQHALVNLLLSNNGHHGCVTLVDKGFVLTEAQQRQLMATLLESHHVDSCCRLVQKGFPVTAEQKHQMLVLALNEPKLNDPHADITLFIDTFGMSNDVRELSYGASPRFEKGFLYALVQTWHAAFIQAIKDNNLDIVRDSIARGINVKDMMSPPPLCLVTSAEMTELLIAAGANLNGDRGMGGNFPPPLSRAIEKKFVDVVRCMLTHGADVAHRSEARSVLPIAQVYKLDNSPESNTIRLIMFDACNQKYKNLRESLFSDPANPVALETLEKEGSAVIETLFGCPNRDGIGLLAVIRRAVKDLTPYPNILNVARRLDDIFVLKCKVDPSKINYFLDLGLDIEALDYWENTLLLIFAAKNNLEVVKTLVERGANLFARNAVGESVLDRSGGVVRPYLVEVIEERRANFRRAIKDGNVEAIKENGVHASRLLDPKLSDDDFIVIVRQLNSISDQTTLIELLKPCDSEGFSVLNHIRRRIRNLEKHCPTIHAAANEIHPATIQANFRNVLLHAQLTVDQTLGLIRLAKEGIDVDIVLGCGHPPLQHALMGTNDSNLVRVFVLSGARVTEEIITVAKNNQPMLDALNVGRPTQLIASPRLNNWWRSSTPSTTETGSNNNNNNNNDPRFGQSSK